MRWHHVHAAVAGLQFVVDIPVWYGSFLYDGEGGEFTTSLLDTIEMSVSAEAYIVVALLMLIGLTGGPVVAYLGYRSLQKQDADPNPSWVLWSCVGFIFWPAQAYAAWYHWRDGREIDRQRAELIELGRPD